MAEKIDKNEYVDNSKVFFDFCCIPTNGQILPLSNMLNGYQTSMIFQMANISHVDY